MNVVEGVTIAVIVLIFELQNTISEGIIEDNLTLEEATNILVGLRQMYELKFNKLWDCFEDVHMKLVRDNAMITGECNALRQQLLEATDVPFIKVPKEKKAKK